VGILMDFMGRLQKVNLKDKILLAVELHAKIMPMLFI
jgi:hypothetical protein